MNYQHKWELVEAEKHQVMKKYLEAMELYDRAISGAKENGYIQEEALANELAAKFYLAWGKEKIAQAYMIDAYYCYVRWGAAAKVTDLENRYPQLLAPILQKANSSSSSSEALDLATLFKASQAISGEIELDKLLATLLDIAIANAGADKCVLLLQSENELQIVALVESGQPSQILSSPTPLALSEDVAISLINQVKHSLAPLFLIDARQDDQFASDRYILKYRPKSVLCSPILKQGRLLGILYLENSLTVGAFTSDRLELLNLICSQAAISLENAQLYQNLQMSENKFRSFVENVNDIIYSTSLDGVFSYLSPQFKDLMGYEVTEFLNQSFSPITHPEDIPVVMASIQRLYETREKQGSIEFRVKPKIGDWRWLTSNQSPVFDSQGNVVGLLGIARDISDRKAAEAQLQLQAQQLEEYAQTLEQKVEERTQELSKALTNLQNTQSELIHSEKMAALGQLTASIAHEINTPLGVIRAAASNIVSAFKNSLQQLPDLLQSLSPQQQEEFLDLVNTSLQNQQSLSTKEERNLRRHFETTLEANSIINSHNIAMQLTLLRTGQDLHPYQSILQSPNCYKILQVAYNMVLQHQSTRSIQQEVDRAAKIVFALKTYSHQSRSDEKSLIQIRDAIEIALTLYQNRLKQGIEVICNYEEVPDLLCNPDELTQVWVNLIDNAIYAIGQQGTLEISIAQKEGRVVVEITNSGAEISIESQALIFEPFFTTKPRGEGSGLGLDIVRQIVRKHDGDIQVRSQNGRVTFSVVIPLPETSINQLT